MEAYVGIGDALRKLGEWEAAREAYDVVINAEPNCIEAYLGIGRALMKLGKNEEAQSYYMKAINEGGLLTNKQAEYVYNKLDIIYKMYHQSTQDESPEQSNYASEAFSTWQQSLLGVMLSYNDVS